MNIKDNEEIHKEIKALQDHINSVISSVSEKFDCSVIITHPTVEHST